MELDNKLKRPKMILFDYGQTLVNEEKFDSIAGNRAVLAMAKKNPAGIDEGQLQTMAHRLSEELMAGMGTESRNGQMLELPASSFDRYLYEYLGLEFEVSFEQIQEVFWNTACEGHLYPTEGIEEFLDWLYEEGIRTAVVSNMMNSTDLLKKRIDKVLPKNHFEFIISSADYLFRKPHPLLFELALRKCGLVPEDVWFCGDNLLCDIQGAYQAGMQPVFYTPYVDYEQDVPKGISYKCVESWRELREIIENIHSAP